MFSREDPTALLDRIRSGTSPDWTYITLLFDGYYPVAAAAVRRRLTWREYLPAALNDPQIRALVSPKIIVGGFVAGVLMNGIDQREWDPASDTQINILSLLDPAYAIGMMVMIWWAFGWRVFAVAGVFWGCQSSAPFYWTGGAFLRQDWLFFLVLAACLVRKKWFKLAGAALETSTTSPRKTASAPDCLILFASAS